MSAPRNLKVEFAIIDVKAGRKGLAKHFAKRPRIGECPKPQPLRVPVVIRGYIDHVWGVDDGISQEFGVTVTSIKTRRSP